MTHARALAALLAAGLAGCATSPTAKKPDAAEDGMPRALTGGVSEDELIPVGSIVIPRAGAKPEDTSGRYRRPVRGEADEKFFQEKFDLAQAAADAGDDETAVGLVTAALELGPPERWDAKLKALRASIKARHIELDVVRADARGERDYAIFEEDVDFVVRLRNVGTRDLVVRPPAGPGPAEVSGSVLALEIHRRDRDIYTTELVRSWTQVVPLVAAGQPDLVVAPERSHEVKVRIPGSEAGGSISGLRVLEVKGDLRLTGASLGIAEPVSRIPIRAGRVVVLPRNYEPIASDPMRSLKKAVNAVAPIHVLIATEFVPAAERPAAVQVLADALAAGDEALVPAIQSSLALLRERMGEAGARALAEPLIVRMRTHPDRATDLADGLVALTATSLAPDVRLWEDWWRRGHR